MINRGSFQNVNWTFRWGTPLVPVLYSTISSKTWHHIRSSCTDCGRAVWWAYIWPLLPWNMVPKGAWENDRGFRGSRLLVLGENPVFRQIRPKLDEMTETLKLFNWQLLTWWGGRAKAGFVRTMHTWEWNEQTCMLSYRTPQNLHFEHPTGMQNYKCLPKTTSYKIFLKKCPQVTLSTKAVRNAQPRSCTSSFFSSTLPHQQQPSRRRSHRHTRSGLPCWSAWPRCTARTSNPSKSRWRNISSRGQSTRFQCRLCLRVLHTKHTSNGVLRTKMNDAKISSWRWIKFDGSYFPLMSLMLVDLIKSMSLHKQQILQMTFDRGKLGTGLSHSLSGEYSPTPTNFNRLRLSDLTSSSTAGSSAKT